MFTMPNGKSIFIVEDDTTVQFLLKLYLSAAWEVQTSFSAEDAETRIPQFRPHIVLTDYHLPGKSGMELFARLKNDWPDTRFVMMTSIEDVELQKQALKSGFDLFLQKPIRKQTLLQSLEVLAN